MQLSRNFEYPEALEQKFRKAKKLEWITIIHFFTAIILMYLVMGQSQAMKSAWIEDLLSLVPPVSFLISSKIYTRGSDQNFPYGYHRVISIAFLISSVALAAVGLFVLLDSVIKLVKLEHATINSVVIFGKQVWLGYLMVAVLVYSTIPAIILGRMKKPIATEIVEKNLFTDAQMNKADWLTGISGVVGVIGIGIGLWWTDAVAAIIISSDILHDGFTNLKHAVLDLMNQVPKTVEGKIRDPVFEKIRKEVEKESWVKQSSVRFRQEGHVYFGEIFIVASGEDKVTEKLEALREKITGMNWRIFDVVIMLVKKL